MTDKMASSFSVCVDFTIYVYRVQSKTGPLDRESNDVKMLTRWCNRDTFKDVERSLLMTF